MGGACISTNGTSLGTRGNGTSLSIGRDAARRSARMNWNHFQSLFLDIDFLFPGIFLPNQR